MWEVSVSRETHDRLQTFRSLLHKWSARVNLVSSDDLRHIDRRHIADSLSLLPFMPANVDSVIDLGSGAGFPGLVLAIVSRVHFTLIEADQRKAAFLVEAARLTEAPVSVIASRIEHAACNPTRLITSRALAPLDQLLCFAKPLLQDGGTCLFPKGRHVDAEISEAQQNWRMTLIKHRNGTSPDGVILQVGQLARA